MDAWAVPNSYPATLICTPHFHCPHRDKGTFYAGADTGRREPLAEQVEAVLIEENQAWVAGADEYKGRRYATTRGCSSRQETIKE